jgi:hypothetical protein
MAKTAPFEGENSGSSPDAATSPPPPLCVFCNAPWTDDMLKIFGKTEIEDGYYEGDYYLRDTDISIDVVCSTCKRLVYKKHITVSTDRKY